MLPKLFSDCPLIQRTTDSKVPELFPAVVVDEGCRDGVEVAEDDSVEVIPGLTDPVVGDSVLGEAVGPDPLGAVARADQGPALFGPLGVGLLLHQVVKPA